MRFRNLLISISLLALMVPVSLAQGQSAPAQTSPQDSSSTSGTAQQPQQPNPADTSGTAQQPTPPNTTGSSGTAQQPTPPNTTGTGGTTQQPASATDTSAAPQPPPVVQEPDASKVKHDGSEKDVDAIGNRKIGGRGLGNWYSLESEINMGRQYAQQIEASVKLVQDPVVTEYVNRIGQNLVRNSDAQVPFTIKVIDSDEINAMALPGGFFYVNSGLILAADEEAELAGVMAHEIAHVAARHVTRQMTRGNLANLATIPLIFVGGGIGYGIYEAAGLGIPLTFLHFQRGFEAEADYLACSTCIRRGTIRRPSSVSSRKSRRERRRSRARWPKLSRPTPKLRAGLKSHSRRSRPSFRRGRNTWCYHLGIRRRESPAGRCWRTGTRFWTKKKAASHRCAGLRRRTNRAATTKAPMTIARRWKRRADQQQN